ncbi:hypothetical protein [Melittangium boletus]|uniref:hypothetical protein n=1 Tax=Melittangium boletus TaxID=83453 RepID=UPI003DA1F32F
MRTYRCTLLLAVLLTSCVQELDAPPPITHYTLWIHGKDDDTTKVGDYTDFSYWGLSSVAAGVNKKAVNWHGSQKIAVENHRVRDALDCFCTGNNWCYVAAHSAGDLQISYAMSMYGRSMRNKKNARPNTSGVCGDAGGTQTGWNLKWVAVASGASGGSELADMGEWLVTTPLVSDLVTTTARAMYNHNTTQAVWFYNYAASQGTLYSFLLPGQDDDAVSYHSTGGVSGASGSALCNPGDWFCDGTLTLGAEACGNGQAKWSFHSVEFRDDSEAYGHSGNGKWEGIPGRVREDVAKRAY